MTRDGERAVVSLLNAISKWQQKLRQIHAESSNKQIELSPEAQDVLLFSRKVGEEIGSNPPPPLKRADALVSSRPTRQYDPSDDLSEVPF